MKRSCAIPGLIFSISSRLSRQATRVMFGIVSLMARRYDPIVRSVLRNRSFISSA